MPDLNSVVNGGKPKFCHIKTPFWLPHPPFAGISSLHNLPFAGVLTDYTFHLRSFHKLETNLNWALLSFWFIYWIFSWSSFLISDFIFFTLLLLQLLPQWFLLQKFWNKTDLLWKRVRYYVFFPQTVSLSHLSLSGIQIIEQLNLICWILMQKSEHQQLS